MPKPPFNPNAAFQPADKPAFDPKGDFTPVNSPAPEQKPNPFQTANVQEGKANKLQVSDGVRKQKQELDDALSPSGINKIASGYILPGMGGKLMQGMGALGRIGIGALTSATQSATSPEDAVTGGLAGGAIQAGLEGMGAVGKGLSRGAGTLKKAYQMATGSPALQQEARGVMQTSADALRNSPYKDKLTDLLGKAQVEINPRDFMGKNDQVDKILNSEFSKSMYGEVPSTLKISGDKLNEIRQSLDKDLKYSKRIYGQVGPTPAVKDPDFIKPAADAARDTLHGISPEASEAFDKVSSGIKGAGYLEKNSASPIAALSTKRPDKIANLKSLGDEAGTDLASYASQLKSASKVKGPASGAIQGLLQTLQGGADSLTGPSSKVTDPRNLSAIMQMLNKNKDQN